jgi:hypothetical protein
MGKRSVTPSTEAEAAALSLSELNKIIAHMQYRAEGMGLSSALRRSAAETLGWLEGQRERLHGVPAPKRKF